MFFFHKVEVDCNFCDMQLSEGYIKTVNDSRNPQRTLVQNPVLFKNQVTIVVNQTSIPTSQTPDCLWCSLFVSRFNISWFQSKSPSRQTGKQCQMEYPDLGVFMCPICMQLLAITDSTKAFMVIGSVLFSLFYHCVDCRSLSHYVMFEGISCDPKWFDLTF